jgi:hypothetical protein
MAEKQGSWGGAREGAGAKSKWQRSEEGTKLVRIPVAIESEVLEAARVIDAGIRLIPADTLQETVTKSSCNETVTKSSERIQQLESEIQQLRQERDRIAQELAACQASQPQPQPVDLEAIRDRVLAELKLGKQAPGYKGAVKALNRLIALIR